MTRTDTPLPLDLVTRVVSAAIGVFSPAAAFRYRVGREMLRNYAAGDLKGPNARWRPPTRTADEDFLPAQTRIVNRCRDLAKDDPYISGAIRKIVTNVVRTGQKFQAATKRKNGEPNRRLNEALESDFGVLVRELDITGHDSLYALQRLILRTCWVDGEVFVRRVWVPKSRFGFKIELLEVNQLDRTVEGLQQNGNVARRGIEFYPDSWKPAAYHFAKQSTALFLSQPVSVRVPAVDIIHVFNREQLGQTHGVPWFVAVVMEAFDLKEYRRFEAIASKVAAAFAVFVKSSFEAPEAPDIFKTADTTIPDYVMPGRIQKLPYGTEIQVAKNDRPGSSFEPYTAVSLRGHSAGFGLSYEAFSHDFQKSSFSSARSGAMEDRYSYRWQQFFLNEKFNLPLWGWFIEAEQLRGVPVDPDEHAYAVDIQSPGWDWIDPTKDGKAAELEIANCLNTRRNIMAAHGLDYDETLAQLKREKEDFKELTEPEKPEQVPGETAPKPGEEAPPAEEEKESSDAEQE